MVFISLTNALISVKFQTLTNSCSFFRKGDMMAESKSEGNPEEKLGVKHEEKPELTRINFNLTPASLALFERIKADCYAASNAEVMKKAVKLLMKCLDAEKRGAKITITERDGKIAQISMF